MAGKAGRSGAKPGNKNALKNGSRMDVRRLTVGELPKEMLSIKREGRAYRRDLEDEVLHTKGEINVVDAHYIDTAAAATIQAGINRWLLRERLEEMSVTDIRGCVSDLVKAKEKRDAAVKALQLDAPPPDPWTVIDGSTADHAHDLEDK